MGRELGIARSCGDSPAAVLGALRHIGDPAAADRPALSRRCTPTDRAGRLRYADVARRAAGWAAMLRSADVHDGDRVALLAESSPDWVVAFLGALWAGAVVV